MEAMPAKTRYTYYDYCLLPDDKRYEVIEGELFVVPSPSVVHQKVSGNLLFLLKKHISETGSGFVFNAPLDVLISDDNVIQPDIIYISDENSRIIGEANISGAPDLVVEVISPSTAQTDYGKKKDLYARFGVKELWIVHPVLQTVDVFINRGGCFGDPARYDRRVKKPLGTVILPGLSISLDEVF
ncbi:MAG: Uma2 family endonuclease [Bacillota bacterium]